MKHYQLIATSLLLSLLAACGNSSGNTNPPPPPPPPGGGSQIGTITLLPLGGSVIANARFEGYNQILPPPSGVFPGSGTCVVSSGSVPPIAPTPGSPLPGGLTITPLDAGPQVSISKAGANYGILEKREDGSDIRYVGSNLDFSSEALSVDVPGATGGFPAFSNVALPTLPLDFSVSSSPSGPIGKDSSFTWTNPMGGSTQMVLLATQQVGSNGYKSFYCVAPDTGSFSLPAQTKTELQNIGFSGSLFLTMRVTSRTETRGNAHLLLTAIRQEF